MSDKTTASTNEHTCRLANDKVKQLNILAFGLDLNCRKDQETLMQRTPGTSGNHLFSYLVLHRDVAATDVSGLIKNRASSSHRLHTVTERHRLLPVRSQSVLA